MSNLADISVFEGLQATQNARFGMSELGVFNATYKTDRVLPLTTKTELDDVILPKINAEEAKFRSEDDIFIAQQRKYREAGDEMKLSEITKQRHGAAQSFDAKMQTVADDLKKKGVILIREEPRVDRVSIDAYA